MVVSSMVAARKVWNAIAMNLLRKEIPHVLRFFVKGIIANFGTCSPPTADITD